MGYADNMVRMDLHKLPVLLFLAALSLLQACRPVERLRSEPVTTRAAMIRFRSGDSLAVGSMHLERRSARGPLVIVADGTAYALDTLDCFNQPGTEHIVIVNSKPYIQLVRGRLDPYGYTVLERGDSLLHIRKPAAARIDFLQKLPDGQLYANRGNALMRLVADDAQASASAKLYRTYRTKTVALIALGAAIAGLGAFTALSGAVISDQDEYQRRPFYWGGSAAFVAGAAILSIPVPILSNRMAMHRNAAINRYNAR